jgi:hypothetical protein
MKFLIVPILLILAGHVVTAQNGYIKLKDSDSTLVGFVRPYMSVTNAPGGLEFWRNKKDKDPLRIPKTEISEFAIKTDTIRVLHQFKPFEEVQTFYEFIEARVVSRGKVSLLVVTNFSDPDRISSFTGGGIVPAALDATVGYTVEKVMNLHSKMYVLEDRNGYAAVAPQRERLRESLLDYFPDKFVEKYEATFGEVTYRTLDEMVKFYNSR